MKWSNVYRGFLIGTSDLIPGVSGGTVAVMLGMYDELLTALSGLFSSEWRNHVNFLLPLGIGMATALLSLSRVIGWLLDNHYVPTQFFFLGLLVGIVPDLLRRAEASRRFRAVHYIVLGVAALLVTPLAFLNPGTDAAVIALSPASAFGLFGAGWLASVAMLLPGISGSFILLVLGVYPTAIYALSTFHPGLIAVIGAGVGVGFIVSSKVIRHLLHYYRDVTFAAIIGLIIGSLAVVWPGFPVGDPFHYIVSGLTFAGGFYLTKRFGHEDRH